ncbi:YhgE/Pip domain-containing protein [Heyndrickxia acidicola]|uniref:YhgE/Pip domain-containing protein n=1 Tax=Heyndrickxia acidicola TaxID=209389 RepID=A0ABU6MHH0_9BACI|nr:YhgE/Pip domain-containing protein [Heyndrickxia acidicola]MED1204121.1 YhgE/Pip domain-containing protein [Heyndrickxia acidicola]
MESKSWLLNEWLQVLKNKKWMAAIIVILFVPSLYSGTYLWANWNPYAHLERLPVAVANDDELVSQQGRTYNLGKDLVSQLHRDKSFHWVFVSKKQADRGLQNNRYYFEIYIPKDFSKRAATFTKAMPSPLNLYYKVNVGSNFLASQIGRTGVDKIREKLSESLSKNYAKMVFAGLFSVSKVLQDASKGSGKLSTNLRKVTDGTNKIINGMNQGKQPIASFSGGAQQLSNAADQLSAGANKINSGFEKVNSGMGSLETGLHTLYNSSNQLTNTVTPISGKAGQYQQLFSDFQKNHPEINTQELQPLQNAGKDLTEKSAFFIYNLQKFNDGLGKAADSSTALHTGTSQLARNVTKLSAGAGKIADSEKKLSTGASSLENGWNSAIQNLTSLKKNLEQITAGSNQLTSQLADGAKKIGSIHAGEQLYSMMANPVHLKEELVHNVPNYGTGLAPYFISLSLFVGALLISTVFPIRETSLPPQSAWLWFLSKFIILAFVSLGHCIITNLILIYAVGLKPVDTGWLFVFTFIASITFMSIIQFLATAADHAGRFLAVILLVLQLTSSSGTFPMELTPWFLQKLHGVLPMTFTVQGFRAAISTGDHTLLFHDVLILVPYFLISVLLTLAVMKIMLHRWENVVHS